MSFLTDKSSANVKLSSKKPLKVRLQQYFIENYKTSLKIRIFNFAIKVLSCILYCVRVNADKAQVIIQGKESYVMEMNYDALLWIETNAYLWAIQVFVAFVSLLETILMFYMTYKGSPFRILTDIHFLLEMVTSAPLIVTVFFPSWRNLYVPAFLNCWLANSVLQTITHDLHRVTGWKNSALPRQMLVLFLTIVCLVFTGTCGMEHLQRAGKRQFDLFTSFYFVMVTFSTVGYGDWYPDTWLSQLYVVILICVAFIVLPSKIENLGQTWLEQKKTGSSFVRNLAHYEKHVVVTIPHLDADFVEDFLKEFYSHSQHTSHLIVLLSPKELDNRMKILLKMPVWAQRVVYVNGIVFKEEDLERVLMQEAVACFVLSSRHMIRKSESDQQTILTSWAIKDYAPHVPQYIQVFRPETKLHLEYAEVVICEDEFKYALLGNNCIFPGISTFISLMMHTSYGEEGQTSSEEWHKTYGFHSGNEIYDTLAERSLIFKRFVDKTFPYASFHAHREYGVCLVGAKRNEENSRILLNPGHAFVIKPDDHLYYMALSKEDSLSRFLKKRIGKKLLPSSLADYVEILEESPKKPWKKSFTTNDIKEEGERTVMVRSRSSSPLPNPFLTIFFAERLKKSASSKVCEGEGCIEKKLEQRVPPLAAYLGSSLIACHMMKKKRPYCCLKLSEACEHCPYTTAREYNWKNSAIIVAVDQSARNLRRGSPGIFNLVIPLRSYFRHPHELRPIVLLFDTDEQPNSAFLDVIREFPLIYWMRGNFANVDDLLRAGICQAEHMILARESASYYQEYLADCDSVINAQKIHRTFPKVKLIAELTHFANMKFMEFSPDDEYAMQQSKFEKKQREKGSHLHFMFRLPFAKGSVFSANLIDRLLYQSFVKPYLVEFLKIILGTEESSGSGNLISITITKEDLIIQTYGRLFEQLSYLSGDIPIGIYRTKKCAHNNSSSIDMDTFSMSSSRKSNTYKIQQVMRELVRTRMECLEMPQNDFPNEVDENSNSVLSYVIINPWSELEIEEGDIIYVLRAPQTTT